MPELPEVETIRAELASTIVGLRVLNVDVRRAGVIRGRRDSAALFEGLTLATPRRHGKQLALLGEGAAGSEPRAMVVHLGMSGQLLRLGPEEAPVRSDHIHVRWELVDARGRGAGSVIFRDPRRFGGIWTYDSFEQLYEARWSGLGPDAAGEDLTPRLLEYRRSVRSVKATMLDQQVMAGVGNIYADEALFEAGIRPQRSMRRLKPTEMGRLAASIRAVLERAITARGSTLRDYRTSGGESGGFQMQHQVYGRGGLACRRCGKALRSGVVGQRSTVWCPLCQR